MENINTWITLISLLVGYFAYVYMLDYLYDRGIIKHRYFVMRLDLIYVEYYKITKKEKGKVGYWFWVNIVSSIIFIISIVVSLFFMLIQMSRS